MTLPDAVQPHGFFAAMAAADEHLTDVDQLRAENTELRALANMWANGYLTAHNKRAQLLRDNAILRADLAAAMEVIERINAIPDTSTSTTVIRDQPILFSANCDCGSSLVITSVTDEAELTTESHEFIANWRHTHAKCEARR